MAVKIGHASIDENGKARSGKAGDQNGKEVKISNYYVHSKGWVVLRCVDPVKRELIAEAMEKACNNSHIGYDQNQRNTLYNEVKDKGFDPSKTTKKVETDCSALVRICIAYAFGRDLVGNIRTVSEPATLVETGQFTKLTDKVYCKSSSKLLRGDILCTPVSGHTVVVLNDGAKANENTTTTKEEVCSVDIKVLKKGAKGNEVKAMQVLLNLRLSEKLGNKFVPLDVDGSFGAKTLAAVKQFQELYGLSVDGVCGPKTWAKLLGVG